MLILIIFAVLAGAGTALSPCVLPVLPALLSATAVGGRRRPLGVVVGLMVTFTITIVGIASVVGGVGLGSDPLRNFAVVVLLVMGLALIVPGLTDRIEARLSPLARFGVGGVGGARISRGDGFASGLVVGAALGFVYTPCAGPILAAVISVSAASGRTIAVAIAYSLGSGVVLLALALGGHKLFDRVRRAGRGPALGRVLGAIMVITAIAIATELDVNFDQYVAQHIPEVNLTSTLEKSHAVESRLPEITGHKPKYQASVGTPSEPSSASQAKLLADARGLKDLGAAPEFTETEDWFNTPGDRPLTLTGLRGHVVLVDFWTYTCINCIRTLPYLKAWDAAYRHDGLTIVGVETPEFSFEHDASNVANAIEQFGISYPVVQDNNMGTWNAYGNEYWPADYLIDATGQVRYAAFGEGDYGQTETAIRALLAESGAQVGAMSHPTDVIVPSEEATPETYLGTNRAQGWINGPHAGTHDYGPGPHPDLKVNEFAYTGTWNIAGQPAEAVSSAGLELEFEAKNAYLVLSPSRTGPSTVQVLLDGHPIPPAEAGADVHDGAVTVTHQRLYSLVSLPGDQQHHLTLRFAPGVTGYAFTFG
ncbi:MAG: cytochrome c biogenesis protein DipZ [Solirubrobacteraceae bacterium]|jgi:cytochrome c biogenesis protein CcdA/thiol-disulfide isomerase/thioredoxin